MRKSTLLSLALLLFITVQAAPVIRAVTNNGNWNASGTWNLGRKPQNGDSVIIPTGITVVLNTQESLNNVYVQIFGHLSFASIFSYLSMNGSSSIVIFTGGSIQATINYLQYIFLGGTTIFSNGSLTGPKLADTNSNGFVSFDPLPVKFLGITVTRKDQDVLVQWSTTMEMEVGRFEIERSFDGRQWAVIGTVNGVNNNNSLQNYSFLDHKPDASIIYYRIKEVDRDGKFLISTIQDMKMDQDHGDISMTGIDGKLLLQFPEQVKGKLSVRFTNFAGQLLDRQTIIDPVGQVVLNTKMKGLIVVTILRGNELKASAKLILR
jgi:hypothetical protein